MFSVSGRRPQDNLFLLNGIEYTGRVADQHDAGRDLGAVAGHRRRFASSTCVSDTYSAAYGKRDGAQISIVTTGGTNQLHGSVYEFVRNSFFDARNYFDGPRVPEFQRNNFGASLGGPIRKNKLFLFANYEGYRQNLGESLVTLVPDATSRAQRSPASSRCSNLWPVANGPEITQNGAAPASPMDRLRSAAHPRRLRHHAVRRQPLQQRYSSTPSTPLTTPTHVSPSANPYSYVDETLREQVLSAEEHHVFSPNLHQRRRASASRGPAIYFDGYVPAEQQALTPSVRPGRADVRRCDLGLNCLQRRVVHHAARAPTLARTTPSRATSSPLTITSFYTVGKHTLEGGVWIQRLQSNDNLAQDQYGQASFASLATFLTGAIKTFTYAPDITELGWRTLFAECVP